MKLSKPAVLAQIAIIALIMNKTSAQIRQEFLDFFAKNGSTVVPSDSLIPSGDKTLLFTSAGMVQFKQHYLGQSKDTFTRAASCQKCFRTSDIEQVGATTRHLTFFEMLGNFSFGDYFKKESIAWGWEFLTKNMGLPESKLYITIYKDDDEADEIWKKIVPASKITRMGEDTNFWNMGDTGPCGPCSEIYIDLGKEVGCGRPECAVGCDCDRYLEIWNHVFTQFDRQADSSLKPLPRKNIDTGMGLERLVAAACGKKSIFDTDLFMPIMEAAAQILKIEKDKQTLSKLRMIADHCRAVAFLIADGIIPSNEGRGYVLRRILRRAVRQGKIFGFNEPFIHTLSKTVYEIMKPAYPDLSLKLANIQSIIKVEEEKFLDTLQSGTDILNAMIEAYQSKKAAFLSGQDVFKLYDTYGFPQDLTKEIAAERGLGIDEKGFEVERKKAQEKSRSAWSGSGERDASIYSPVHKRIGDSVFTGYDADKSEGTVLEIFKDGKEVERVKEGELGELILSSTSFYAESGGQTADKGKIAGKDFEAQVLDVFKPIGSLFVHKVKVLKGALKKGDKVETLIDWDMRKQTARHHSATHILHRVLREVLGAHITQAGSLVCADYLRFDFTHFAAVSREDLLKIEREVNAAIRADMPVIVKSMGISEAREAGAMALFGEKYGDTVRTISIKGAGDVFSMELCGGCHIQRTGEIGFFKMISESSIGSGARRIEAVCGLAAEQFVLNMEEQAMKIAHELNAPRDEVFAKVQKQMKDIKALENQLGALKSSRLSQDVDAYIKEAADIKGVTFLPLALKNADIKLLRDISDKIRNKLPSSVLLIASSAEGKASFIVSVSADYVKKGLNAGNIAKGFAADIKGSGGGKADFAQGGSKEMGDISIEDVLKNAHKHI